MCATDSILIPINQSINDIEWQKKSIKSIRQDVRCSNTVNNILLLLFIMTLGTIMTNVWHKVVVRPSDIIWR
jgi:hypothetical protein